MKKLFTAALGLAAFAVTGLAPVDAQTYDATVAARNPLAHYTFTGSTGGQTADVVNGKTLTLQNGATVNPTGGPVVNGAASGALVLANGATGTAFATSGGSNPLLGGIGSTGSIVAWINLASLPSTRGRIFSIAGESQSGNDFDFQIDTDNVLRFYTDGGSATAAATAFGVGNLGQWLFLAGTFTAGGARDVYINGVTAGTSIAGGHSANNAPFYVGQSNVFGGRYFDGSIAKVSVYGTALGASDIADIYRSAFVTATPGAVPEPASWALMIAGVGLVGHAMRRRPAAAGRRLRAA